jgi:hypothetical protein
VEFGGSLSSEERRSGQQALSDGERASESENVEEINQTIDAVQRLANELTKVMMNLPDDEAT